ncbi:MAG: FtsW/RodA/SpoVE family cell cycle protein [Treponema sp.]|nr:FtsW/RodA/SpoVE family cell cycle protein [Treponema sp.]
MAYPGRERAFRYDYCLIAVTVLLTLLGLVTLFSASYLFALNQPDRFRSGLTPINSNIIASVIMIFLFPLLALVKIDWLKSGYLVFALMAATAVLNMLPFIPFFQKANHRAGVDAMRWIVIRAGGREQSFQPSELIKVVLPLYLAYILDKNKDRLNKFMYGPLPPALWTGFFCFLVLRQSNFSEAALIALTGFSICFISGIRLHWFVIALGVLILAGFSLIYGDQDGRWYQRMSNFGRQQADPTDTGYQITLSEDAIRSGGFWGKGIGQGTVKTRTPEVHGDFVFASYAEESGFIGVVFYMALVGIFAFLCYYTAWRSKVFFVQLLAFGLVTPIVTQTMMNIAVVANMIPTTGVPLPFVSSGGSSLLMTLTGAALLVNLARQNILSESGEGRYAW